MPSSSRRSFLGSAGLAAAACVTRPLFGLAVNPPSPFKIAVINNEISQDFDHACSVAANDFGMQWMELREMWNKNITALSDSELADTEKILAKYNLRVTDIASPLFKVDWPGAPRSQFSPKRDAFNADFNYKQQEEVLERCIALCKRFKTNKIRCFDFWRIDDVAPYRSAINERLQQTAEICGKQGLTLVIENEHGLQHCHRPRVRRNSRRRPLAPLRPQLGPRQRRLARRARRLPHRMGADPQEPHPSLPRQERDQRSNGQDRVVTRRQGHHRLDRPVQSTPESRLPQRRQPRNPLDRRRLTRSIHPHQLGRHETRPASRRNPVEATLSLP